MRTAEIRKQIQAAVDDERKTNRLRQILVQIANARGHRPTNQQLDDSLVFIRDYIAHVPETMDAIAAAAPKLANAVPVQHMLSAAEQYWFTGLDIIPDHIGLTGLLDDAYYVLSLMHGISDNYRQRTGTSLLTPNLGPANIIIRAVIGEPHASVLDLAIQTAQQGPQLQTLINQIVGMMERPMSVPDPIWGSASVEEIANARMGAMGIV